MKNGIVMTMALGCVTLIGSSIAGAQTMSCTPGQMGAMSPTADQDKQFVQAASLSDFTEMKFSQLALQKSSNAQVKAYAQKMITDHQKLEAEMKPGADKLGVTPATALDADHQQKYDALSQLSGAEFDKQYISDMSTDHHKSLDAFKSEQASTKDMQLKPVVKKGEKVVAQHTVMADKMQTKMGGTASGM